MADAIEFDPADWVTAGAVGTPGRRTFYIQARRGQDVIAVVVEKAQVQVLAELAQQLLGRIGVTVTPDDLDTERQQLIEPVVPAWRAGSLALGMDEQGERFVLEAEELVEEEEEEDEPEDEPEGRLLRLWFDREQLTALAAYAAWVVVVGARPACPLCNLPLDPDTEHVCPALNGNGAR